MIRFFAAVAVSMAAGPVAAHVGHLGDVAGHDHWIALGALGLAAAIATAEALRRKRRKKAEEEPAEEEDAAEAEPV